MTESEGTRLPQNTPKSPHFNRFQRNFIYTSPQVPMTCGGFSCFYIAAQTVGGGSIPKIGTPKNFRTLRGKNFLDILYGTRFTAPCKREGLRFLRRERRAEQALALALPAVANFRSLPLFPSLAVVRFASFPASAAPRHLSTASARRFLCRPILQRPPRICAAVPICCKIFSGRHFSRLYASAFSERRLNSFRPVPVSGTSSACGWACLALNPAGYGFGGLARVLAALPVFAVCPVPLRALLTALRALAADVSRPPQSCGGSHAPRVFSSACGA